MIQSQALNGAVQRERIRGLFRPAGAVADRRAAVAADRDALQAFDEKVFCLCLGFLGNAADARDVTQDTLAKALAHYSQDNPEHVQAWLMAIARNACLDCLRRRKTRGPQQPVSEFTAIDWQTPEDHARREDEIRIVRKAISLLPGHLREVLVLREYGELSYEEIGQSLGVHTDAVRSRLNRARQAVLRYYLEEQR